MAKVEKTLGEIASLVRGTVVGDPSVTISGVSGIREARPGDISFLANPKYLGLLEGCKASAMVVDRDLDVPETYIPLIRVSNADMAFATIVQLFAEPPIEPRKGIHPLAFVGENVTLGHNVSLAPYAVVEDGAKIGDGTVIHPLAYVGPHARLGCNCLIYPHVVIRERVVIGDRVVIHSGTIIGSDGFGYSTIKGVHHKIPQIGNVQIDDDVEIGANVTIDRARFDKTWIKRGTKIDNLVQIAHNVALGENTVVTAQTGIAGSAKVGNHCIIAAQSGIIGHIEVGDNAVVAARSGVTKDVPPNITVSGFPAQPHEKMQKALACMRRLPELLQIVKDLGERIERLEQKTENSR
jgi:UDP-3-O-[3-hydroxymyristoyl] glucosamine N-acyltransferase